MSNTTHETLLPEVTFITLILSLNTSALVHLGQIADPSTNEKAQNLPIAKHTIDTIALLQDKTKGNLTEEEAKLLEHILYELRMMYVRCCQQAQG